MNFSELETAFNILFVALFLAGYLVLRAIEWLIF